MDIYREEILEEWQNPKNFGKMKVADMVIEQINPLCGDELTFYFKFQRDKEPERQSKRRGSRPETRNQRPERKIEEVSFTGNGCAISIAAASMLTEHIKNKEVSKIAKMKGEEVLKLIGGQIAPARLKCALLGLEVIKKLNGR